MQFHISRNGQNYGPYTREDLERYVSTGNVLPTDMAKSDSMAEWAPVSEILAGRAGQAFGQQPISPSAEPFPQDPASPFAGQAGFGQQQQPSFGQQQPGFQQPGLGQPAFNANPYGQPAFGQPTGYPQQGGYGAGFLANSAYPDPPSMSWGIVLLIDVFTCGLFQLFWNINMALWLKKVRPSASVPLYCFIAVAVLFLFTGGLAVPSLMHPRDQTGPMIALIGLRGLLSLALWVAKLVGRFVFRSELEKQYGPGGPENINIDVNPVMLFFFGGLYLQSHLSSIAALKAAARMNAMQPR